MKIRLEQNAISITCDKISMYASKYSITTTISSLYNLISLLEPSIVLSGLVACCVSKFTLTNANKLLQNSVQFSTSYSL